MNPPRVLVVTSEWPTEHQPVAKPFVVEQVASLRRQGVEVDVVPTLGGRRLGNYRRARSNVARQLAGTRFDIVHVHMGQCALAVPRTDVPMIITFHGSDLLGIVGRTGRYTPSGWLLTRFSRHAAKRAAGVILVAQRLVPRLPAGVSYDVIPCGVDLQTFRPGSQAEARRELGLPPRSKLVVFSGSPNVPRKRFDLALDALRILAPRVDVTLLTLKGEPPDRVRKHLVASDALLVSARHETGPLMAKEAAACNVPIVSVDVGDVGEWLPGDPASRITSSEPRAIADALAEILSPGRAACRGREIVQRFEIDAVARRIIRVYDRVAEARRSQLRRGERRLD